ncbi:toll-like receptor 6 [Teleopsis dalmanni]|uniref:toll-like receptor 6 n=1 Tax=Teleopsis dalmanni TaxID=139649 RepID=UPI0018CF85B2|nr:toll-like receptor 6 [Teleopsis dalmanni]
MLSKYLHSTNPELYGQANLTDTAGKNSTFDELNLSNKNITKVNGFCFSNFKNVVHLNLSHNSIDSINDDAFGKLKHIHSIDLSYNRLETLNGNIFQANLLLHSINLEGNKFNSITDAPFIDCKSLLSLNLRNTQLKKVTKEMLRKMPQLEELNVSDNLITTLNSDTLTYTQHLKCLNLNNNTLKCDDILSISIVKMRKLGVKVEITACNVTDSLNKIRNQIDQELTVGGRDKYCAYFASIIKGKSPRDWYNNSNPTHLYDRLDIINSVFIGISFGVMSLLGLIICLIYVFQNLSCRNCSGISQPIVTHSDPWGPSFAQNNSIHGPSVPLDCVL